MDGVNGLIARNAANHAASQAKGAAGKIKWKNFTTYAKILVWVAICGHLISAPYLTFKALGQLEGDLAGVIQILGGLIVLLFELVPCLKCCKKTKAVATKMDKCMSVPMLRALLYIGLAAGEIALVVFALTKGPNMWIGFMMVAPVVLLTAGGLYTASFIVNDKCKCSRSESYSQMDNNKSEDVEAPQTTGDRIKSGFGKFGSRMSNTFKKNPFSKGGGEDETASAAASVEMKKKTSFNPFSRNSSNNEEAAQPKEVKKKTTFNPFSRNRDDDEEAQPPKASESSASFNPFRR